MSYLGNQLARLRNHSLALSVWGLLVLVCCQGCVSPDRHWYGAIDEVAVARMKKYGPCAWEKVNTLQTMRGVSEEQQEALVPKLRQQLESEDDTYVRLEILQTLKTYKVASAQAVFFGGLKDPDPEIRALCCECLGKHPNPDNAKYLAEMMASDTNVDVRLAAAEALGQSKEKIALTALGGALEDPDPAMQYRAMASLKSATGKELGDDVNEWRRYMAGKPEPAKKDESVAGKIVNSIF